MEGQPQGSGGERLCGQGAPRPDPLNGARQSVASDPSRERAEQGGGALPQWAMLGLQAILLPRT